MYPRLLIDLNKFTHNAKYLLNLCNSKNINLSAVTKVFCADPKMVEILCGLPFKFLADSRIENIKSYPENHKIRTIMLRLPQISEALDTVKYCDISLNSELPTLKALSQAASAANVRHGIILMVDLGDLREGIYYDNMPLICETLNFILSQKSLSFEGIGTNLTCYGSVLATTKNLQKLCDIAGQLNTKVKIISGGNSSSLYLLEKDAMPKGINNLRLGESIVRGVETAFGLPFMGLKQDVITLEAEIIEIMNKPSVPEGEIGINAFGEKPHYEDFGIRRRAILAVGRQDTDYEGLKCTDPRIRIIGTSSDHLIVDVTESEKLLNVGDTLTFSLSYGAILARFTSNYVKRKYIGGHHLLCQS